MIKTVKKALGKRGRDIVTYSGTEHMCRLMVEGFTREETENTADKSQRWSKKS